MFLLAPILIGVCVTDSPADANDSFEAAGCYLPVKDGVVVGVNRLTNSIQLPIGRRDGSETPRVTAARETEEETGIEVDVGLKLVSIADGDVHIFLCRPRKPVTDYTALQPTDRVEVKEVLVIEPATMTNFDGREIDLKWRYDRSRWMIRWLDKIVPRTPKS